MHHLQQLEAENISKYDSFASGYNSNIGGAGLHGVKMSEDQKQLLRKSSRKCAVKLVPENGEEPFTLESIIETSRFLGTNPGRVYNHIKSNQPLNGYKLEKVI